MKHAAHLYRFFSFTHRLAEYTAFACWLGFAVATAASAQTVHVRDGGKFAEANAAEPCDHGPRSSIETIPSDLSYGKRQDPLEPFNRSMAVFNDVVDAVTLRPIAMIYRAVVPAFLREGFQNIIFNISQPVILINEVLQGDGENAEKTLVRFLVNTTVGFGGIVDVAQYAGIEPHGEDFGQTLAVYDVPSGPYIVLPIIGPSTPRHFAGLVVDFLTNPSTWLLGGANTVELMSPIAVELIIAREAHLDQIDAVRRSSLDFYAAMKDIYGQRRKLAIANGDIAIEDLPPLPECSW